MEITAALEAVRSLSGPLVVVTDSTYVCNCFRDRWWEKWMANGWRNSARKDVANRDLWEPLVAAVQATPGRVRFEWVKGHAGDPMSGLGDRVAVDAARTQTGRQGVGRPDELGPADVPAAGDTVRAASGGPPPPAGHRVVVAGLRPPGLGGYEANPVADGVRSRVSAILQAKAQI